MNTQSNRVVLEAAKGQSINIMQMGLRNAGNPDVQTDGGLTPLHIAAANGNLEMVETLYKAGCDMQMMDHDGQTALHHAASVSSAEHVAVSKYLMDKGLDPNQVDFAGRSAIDVGLSASLEKAVSSCDTERATELLGLGAVWALEEPLWFVAMQNGMDDLAIVQAAGSAPRANGERPLHTAVRTNNMSMVCALADHRDELDNLGQTPLFYANTPDTATALLNAGAGANEQDAAGDTPLHTANPEVTMVLLNNGADPYIRNGEGQAPIDTNEHARAEMERLRCDELAVQIVQEVIAHRLQPLSNEDNESFERGLLDGGTMADEMPVATRKGRRM